MVCRIISLKSCSGSDIVRPLICYICKSDSFGIFEIGLYTRQDTRTSGSSKIDNNTLIEDWIDSGKKLCCSFCCIEEGILEITNLIDSKIASSEREDIIIVS
jgi:hypothetical protein